ncbi:casein kinase II subunit beta isoform X1 [Carex littledalei]|uniref:Casein kinase II subunit beta n=1 Tax=Carex littledalei TaxID=544730 RepID=A0A833VF46_9POAL|nr:casein kinase II subunit beta isoform X1 [Carex littledalei]
MLNPGSSTSARSTLTATRSNPINLEASSSSSTKKITSQLSKDAKPPPATISETGSEETELSTSEGDDDTSWITWFCGLRGNELLCEVDEEFIQDDFNLCGLQAQVSHYDHALDMILDNDSFSGELDDEEHSGIENAAEMLYGLIHARYILTSKGINAMHEKYKRVDFGRCPRVFCEGQPCLPLGTSDIPCNSAVKIYCPKCEDIYFPRCKYQSNMDGAYIGTTFPHLYLMSYPSSKPAKASEKYVPRVFGFKLHKDSK